MVGSFNAEVATYSSSLVGFLAPPFLLFGFLYYAVNLAVIEDLRVRLRLQLRHLLLLGLLLGLLEEGWYVKTLTSPQAPVTAARVLDFNPLWALITVSLHAVLTVGLTFVFVDLVLPDRDRRPLLSRRHYVAALLYLAAAFAVVGVGHTAFPSARGALVVVALTTLCLGLVVAVLWRHATAGAPELPPRSDAEPGFPRWREWAALAAACVAVAGPLLQPTFALVPLLVWAAWREERLGRRGLVPVVILAIVCLHLLNAIAGLRYHPDYVWINYAASLPVGVAMALTSLYALRRDPQPCRT